MVKIGTMVDTMITYVESEVSRNEVGSDAGNNEIVKSDLDAVAGDNADVYLETTNIALPSISTKSPSQQTSWIRERGQVFQE